MPQIARAQASSNTSSNTSSNGSVSGIAPMPADGKKTLVLLGTGWGTTTILKALDAERFNVVVVSPRNYFLFTPLLPSCTVGTTESRSIMEPIRHIVGRRGKDIRYCEAECTDIDMGRKELVLQRQGDPSGPSGSVRTTRIGYDQLVVGVGATYNTFGTPGVQQWGLFLKEMGDATKIRQRLKDTIEKASFGDLSDAELDRLLHVVVVGGGPTGVEFAGELHDLVAEDLNKWVPGLSRRFRITLVEAQPHILPSFDERLVFYTQRVFKKNGIALRTGTSVKEVTEKTIIMEGTDSTMSEMPYGLLVWSAGIRAREFAHTLRSKVPDVQTSRRGLIIDDYLRVKGADDIWALGDCAVSKNPPLAQVASQQGKWLAKAFNELARDAKVTDPFHQIDGKIKPFEYSSNGALAYIGGEKAIAQLPLFNTSITIGGPFTSLFWKAYCLWELSSVRSSLSVATDWAKRAMFGRTMSVD
ncbi:NADH:ubiquinone oxidoreductase [Coemansia biformis]|uniref:NADH:ubiquinone reductase (non-electrogenic) n=1 Tax=Coemansia biformis TaxID=1286918 RepID=A0A9W8D1F6_9FUNG|nr:NADH:ubiquinone oxidoreductase [Coemansia biformis]